MLPDRSSRQPLIYALSEIYMLECVQNNSMGILTPICHFEHLLLLVFSTSMRLIADAFIVEKESPKLEVNNSEHNIWENNVCYVDKIPWRWPHRYFNRRWFMWWWLECSLDIFFRIG